MRLAFLLSEGFLCEKLGLPKDIDPEFLDFKDYIDIFELYFEALPSFIYLIRDVIIQMKAHSPVINSRTISGQPAQQ